MLEKFFAVLQAAFSILSPCPDFESCDNCGKRDFEIQQLGRLPSEIEESSGVAIFNELLLTHSDNGPAAVLYGVSSPFAGTPETSGVIQLADSIVNHDWEDLATDSASYIYIGDFGNNRNNRKNLSIVKYDPFSNSSEKIRFTYEDQTEFPPKKRKDRNFDCEAFFWANDSLFLFSKNQGNDPVKIYVLPDQPGEHIARLAGTLDVSFPITSADISPDGRMVALLSYGKVLLYSLTWEAGKFPGFSPLACINFRNSGQSEAITFLDNRNWLITNEDGKVFWMKAHYELLPPLEFPLDVPLEMELPHLEGRSSW